MTSLFEPLPLRDLTIPNRIWVAPMCQYSVEARDGVPTDWHLVHLGAFAQGGFGLVLTEATAVSPEGRISPQDTGIWNDQQAQAWRRITTFAHSQGSTIGIQLAHAGRKASTLRHFPGEPGGVANPDQGGWQPVGPSALGFPDLLPPTELDAAAIDQVVSDFAAAATRSAQAGFDVLEIHAAHGYLLHQFLSSHSNQRTDQYGGSFDNRARLLLRVTDAIRQVWQGVLFVRISATDWTPGQGWDVEQSVELSRQLREHGVDLVDVSSGGNVPAGIEVSPGYQVGFAERIRREAGIATGAVGLITDAAQAQAVLDDQRADAVLLGRLALRDPHWPQRAAHELGVPADQAPYQPQHVRGAWR